MTAGYSEFKKSALMERRYSFYGAILKQAISVVFLTSRRPPEMAG